MSYKISFVCPTRNRLEWIGESIQSMLSQTIKKDVEVVIVDDASTDGTKEFLDDWAGQFPNVKIVHNETQQGGGESRNIGMKAASAPIIAVMDDDDIACEERAELSLKHFEKNPNSELVNFPYLAVGYFNERLEEFGGSPFDYTDYKNSGRISYFCNPTTAYKKESALSMGGYPRETDKETDDLQFVRNWVKAGKKIDFQPGFMVTFHRSLPDSMMVRHRSWKPEWVKKK